MLIKARGVVCGGLGVGGSAWYRTPGLPAGGAGMCRVEVDAGGNLQRAQNMTPGNI